MDERRQAPGATAGADLLLEQDGPVAVVTFNRPEARNAMTFDMYEALHDACERFDRDPGVRVVVLRGAGERAFASGTDIRQFLTFKTREDALGYEARVSRVLSRIAGMTKPTLAMVQGDAVGGGLFMALACDLRLAAPHARFGAPVARTLGNFVAPTSLALLVATVGPVRARELAGGIAEHAPLTLAAAKEATRRLLAARSPGSLEDLILSCYLSQDFQEGVRAFLEKRKPRWQGR